MKQHICEVCSMVSVVRTVRVSVMGLVCVSVYVPVCTSGCVNINSDNWLILLATTL